MRIVNDAWWLILAFGIAIMFVAMSGTAAPARDVGQWEMQAPDISDYYKSLKQPDQPTTSCCGESDAYFADRVDECDRTKTAESDPSECVFVAIITDDRDDEIRKRPHIPIGTRFAVPERKIRKKPIANPTDHTVIFIGSSTWIYCYEPGAGL